MPRRLESAPVRLGGSRGPRFGMARASLTSGLAIGLVAVLLVAPSAAGIPVTHSVRHGAPFHGFLHTGHSLFSSGCGAFASFPVLPKFNLTTGIGWVAEKSAATGCGPAGFSDFAGTGGIAGFDSLPFVFHKAALPNLSFNFTPRFVVNLSATVTIPGAWASCQMYAVGTMWDMTTGSVANSIRFSFSYITNLSTTGYVNASWTLSDGWGFIPGNFTAGHQYFISMYFEAYEYTNAPSHTAAVATASFNMATGSEHFRADWWQVG
jgi:hypothetical protein